jgi:hypothetical protein
MSSRHSRSTHPIGNHPDVVSAHAHRHTSKRTRRQSDTFVISPDLTYERCCISDLSIRYQAIGSYMRTERGSPAGSRR